MIQPDRGEYAHPQRRVDDHPRVHGDAEQRQVRQRVSDQRRARAGEQSEERDRGEEAHVPRADAPDCQQRGSEQ